MNRSEDVPHLRSHFRQSDDAGKIELVRVLRDKAIEQLGSGDAALSPSQKSAAALLSHCSEALSRNALPDRLRDWILDAYAGLDADAVNTGKRFIAGRQPNSGGPIRKAIAKLLKKTPAMKNPKLWDEVTAKPPRGWTHYDNSQGQYLEGKTPDKTMTQRRFFNVCSEERKKLKS